MRIRPLLWALCLFLTACGSDPGGGTTDPPPDSLPEIPDTTTLPPPDTVPEPPKPISEYEQTFIDSGLVDIQEFIPGIRVDLKYSTTDNFLSTDVYADLEKCFLRPEAAEKLKKAQEYLQELHPDYSLHVFDGARPRRVQAIMWDTLDVPFKRNYLAPPWEGSVHNYGCAVDLSISNAEGKLLDMGTEFDFFGKLAQPQLESKMLASGELTEAQHENRLLLRKVMKKAGFYPIHTEWWHFNAFVSKKVKTMFSIIP